MFNSLELNINSNVHNNRKKLRSRSLSLGGFGIWTILLIVVAGYATLNRGFSYIGSYPLFIGEYVIIIYILSIRHHTELPIFVGYPVGVLWVIFLIYSSIRFSFSANYDIFESIRNSVYWVYTIFLYFGFVMGRWVLKKHKIEKLEKYFLYLMLLIFVYYMLFPFKRIFLESTVFLYGNTSFIGYYSSLQAISIGFSFYAIYYTGRIKSILTIFGLILIIGVAQSRAAMVGLFAIMLYLVLKERRSKFVRSLGLLFALLSVAIMAMVAFDIEIRIPGQRGALSARFLTDMFVSIYSESDNISLQGSRGDRLDWWLDVINRTMASGTNLVFGLGVNEVLVDRGISEDYIIRYPHNSFVSVFAFGGLFGFVLYVGLIVTIFLRVQRCRRDRRNAIVNWYPVFAIGFFSAAFFSTVLEAPFHSAVYWMISGLVYAFTVTPRNVSPIS